MKIDAKLTVIHMEQKYKGYARKCGISKTVVPRYGVEFRNVWCCFSAAKERNVKMCK